MCFVNAFYRPRYYDYIVIFVSELETLCRNIQGNLTRRLSVTNLPLSSIENEDPCQQKRVKALGAECLTFSLVVRDRQRATHVIGKYRIS